MTRQAEGFVRLHRELEVAYCRLVTITTDNLTETNEYRTGVGGSLVLNHPCRFVADATWFILLGIRYSFVAAITRATDPRP